VHRNLGLICFSKSDFARATEHYTKLNELEPKVSKNLVNLGLAKLASGDATGGVDSLKEAVKLPDADLAAFNSLAWALSTHRNPKVRNAEEAEKAATQAVAMADEASLPNALRGLAAAQAEKADFTAASTTLIRAIDLVKKAGDEDAKQRLLLDLFEVEASRPLRD
jgi:Flp pilus assembly protein TadD